MKKLLVFLSSSILILSLSGCTAGYRYQCQDPENWEKAECNPPQCMATGECTKDIIGEKAWAEYQKTKGNK